MLMKSSYHTQSSRWKCVPVLKELNGDVGRLHVQEVSEELMKSVNRPILFTGSVWQADGKYCRFECLFNGNVGSLVFRKSATC